MTPLWPLTTSWAKDYKGHSFVRTSFTEPPNTVHFPFPCSVDLQHAKNWHFQCMLAYFVVSIIRWTRTWTTGSLTCVCDLFACVYMLPNSPNYLAQLFISYQSNYTNTKNLYVPRPRVDLFKTSISFAGASLWNSMPQNIKSCISLPCFKRNLHKYMSENNLSSNLDGFVWITRLPKNIECCIHVFPSKKFNSDISAHL